MKTKDSDLTRELKFTKVNSDIQNKRPEGERYQDKIENKRSVRDTL